MAASRRLPPGEAIRDTRPGRRGPTYTITRAGRIKRRTSEEVEAHGSPRLVADIQLPLHGRLRLTAREAGANGTRAVLVARFEHGQVAWIKSEEEAGRLHERLWEACQQLPGDFRPWGQAEKSDPRAPGGRAATARDC